MRPRLVSLFGTHPAEVALSDVELTIGRDVSNSIHLEDPAVSSRHCVIAYDGRQYILKDRGSTNGTFVNGKAAAQVGLKHGDEIQVGHMRFHFLVEEGNVPPTPAVTIEESDAETLIARPRSLEDNALPSGNAMAAMVLLRLGAWTGDARYRAAADASVAPTC